MTLPRPCLNHPRVLARPGRSLCDACQARTDRARWARHAARRASAPGDGAAARLRYALNARGWGVCRHCHAELPASALEVDHLRPLAQGGTDYEDNLQILCSPCHRVKSTAERRGSPPKVQRRGRFSAPPPVLRTRP